MTKTDLIFSAFSSRCFSISQFNNSAFAVSFHFTRSDARVRFDSGVILIIIGMLIYNKKFKKLKTALY